jgi:hypothetical protein
MKFKRRHGEFVQECVLSECYTATDAQPPILPACHQPLLPAFVFVTRDTVRYPRLFFRKICSWTDLFVMRGIREPRFHCTIILEQDTSTKSPSFYMTLRPSNLSCDSNYYVSRQILAPPPLLLQKHSDIRTHDFAHSTNVWHWPRLSKVTCAWSWRLCVINPTIRTDSTNCTAPNRFSHYSLYRFFILTIKHLCNFDAWYYNRNQFEFKSTKFEPEARTGVLWLRSLHPNLEGPFILWLLSG